MLFLSLTSNNIFSLLLCTKTGNNNFDEVEGIITGGNLAIIATTLGTWYEIDVKDKILFLEDVEEPVGSIHRMLTHLKNCGKLNECKAIIFGNFADCGNKYDENYKESTGQKSSTSL